MEESTIDRIARVLINNLCCERAAIKPEARLAEDLNADSLDMVEINLDLEEEFDVLLSTDGLDGIRTVGDLVAFVDGAMA